MKVALLGSAPSSIQRAPFQNSEYAAWTQGKAPSEAVAHGMVPGDWDLWACSPGCWAVSPRATRWFEIHRWEPGQPWFSPEYCQFLRDFKGPVYTGSAIPEIKNHVVYPIDKMEEKFASYFFTSSLALMLALAIDEIEQIREARKTVKNARAEAKSKRDALAYRPGYVEYVDETFNPLPQFVDAAELDKEDSDDVIGLWGVDMSASEEWGYQRPGCQFFILEAMRRGIGVYLPPESDLMRPMPVYGISEWDHNYIKLTCRARELNAKIANARQQINDSNTMTLGIQGEQAALSYFVNTWTSPYGMPSGVVIRQAPGTGLGSGITHLDGRPLGRMPAKPSFAKVVEAMSDRISADE